MIELLFRDSLWKIALISGIPLVACVVTGLTAAVFQAATQIQEQSVGFLVKFLTVSIVFVIFGGWFGAEVLALVRECLGAIQQVGR